MTAKAIPICIFLLLFSLNRSAVPVKRISPDTTSTKSPKNHKVSSPCPPPIAPSPRTRIRNEIKHASMPLTVNFLVLITAFILSAERLSVSIDARQRNLLSHRDWFAGSYIVRKLTVSEPVI